jgi:hypothetical protein
LLGEAFKIIQDGIADLRDKMLGEVGLNGNLQLDECRKRRKNGETNCEQWNNGEK